MAMAMATNRAASQASLKNILAVAALLCAAVAASFFPLSSAGKTAHEHLCISTLAPDSRSRTSPSSR